MADAFTARDALDRLGGFPTFTSGSRALDGLLGGGFRAGRVTEVYGRSGCGKTQLAMQTALCVAASNELAVYVDTEGAFRPERVLEMAEARNLKGEGILDRIVYVRVDTTAAQSDTIRAISRRPETADAKFVAVDTLTRNFSLDFPGSRNLPNRQGALDVLLSEIARDSFLHGRAYLLANRVTFSQQEVEARIGGRTLEQLVHTSVHLEKNSDGISATRETDKVSVKIGPIGKAGLT